MSTAAYGRRTGATTGNVLIVLSILTVGLAIHYLVVVRRSAQIPATMGRALMGAARQGQLRHLLAGVNEREQQFPALFNNAMRQPSVGLPNDPTPLDPNQVPDNVARMLRLQGVAL